jgi:hypothetical protein
MGNIDMSGVAEKLGEMGGAVMEKLQDIEMPDVDLGDIEIPGN